MLQNDSVLTIFPESNIYRKELFIVAKCMTYIHVLTAISVTSNHMMFLFENYVLTHDFGRTFFQCSLWCYLLPKYIWSLLLSFKLEYMEYEFILYVYFLVKESHDENKTKKLIVKVGFCKWRSNQWIPRICVNSYSNKV